MVYQGLTGRAESDSVSKPVVLGRGRGGGTHVITVFSHTISLLPEAKQVVPNNDLGLCDYNNFRPVRNKGTLVSMDSAFNFQVFLSRSPDL